MRNTNTRPSLASADRAIFVPKPRAKTEMRNATILAAVIIAVLLAARPSFAQEPIERDIDSPADVVALIAAQTEVMQQMSEKLSRIETIVSDTNEKTATGEEVAAILAKLEAMKLNVTSDPCAQVTSTVTSSPIPLAVGERIVAINDVPVTTTTTTTAPCLPNPSPPSLPPLPVDLPVSPGEVIIDRRFGSDITARGDNITISRGPFGRLDVQTNATPQCYTTPTGQTICPGTNTTSYGYTNTYTPSTVTSPYNDGRGISNGSGGRQRCGLLRRLFGRR